MHCPKCQESLEATYEGLYEDIIFHRCMGCAVLWIPAKSLSRLDGNISVDSSHIEWAESDVDEGLICPSCVGTYRSAGPQLHAIGIPTDPDIHAHRCRECRGFLMTATTLELIRALVLGRAVPVR